MPSHRTLSDETLERLATETVEQLKRTGAFDDIRMKFTESAWADPGIKKIIARFEDECRSFCTNEDLSMARPKLRKKLEGRLNPEYRPYEPVRSYVKRILRDREDELRSTFERLAGEFLRNQYIPQEPDLAAESDPVDMELESQNGEADGDCMEEEIERPAFSPIESNSPLSNRQDDNPTPIPEPITPPRLESNMVEVNGESSETNLANATPEDISEDDYDDLLEAKVNEATSKKPEQLYAKVESEPKQAPKSEMEPSTKELVTPIKKEPSTGGDGSSLLQAPQLAEPAQIDLPNPDYMSLSPVSSVHTEDLSDYDERIPLSDDEANLVGQPKNSKVPFSQIQDQINDLQTNTANDSTASENPQTSRRASRTRRLNPRYMGEEYIG